MGALTKKAVVLVAVVLIAVVAVVYVLLGLRAEGADPLGLLRDYEVPPGEYGSPQFITQGLPAGFQADTPTVENSWYPDGTPVVIKVISYTKEPDTMVIAQILDACGETFTSNTPELDKYTFEMTNIGGNRAVKYAEENVSGYVWYYGGYSIAIYTSSAGFPGYLSDFAEIYMNEYPSTL